jgi:CheY-like chemotaxis protein
MSQRILIVDDDEDIRETLIEVVQDSGYEAVGAAHGRDALDRLRDGGPRPCVILLDLMMPVMDGWQFREAQRNDPELAGIPVVVISAYRHRPSVTELDAAEYLNKPVQVDSLIEALRRHCPGAP